MNYTIPHKRTFHKTRIAPTPSGFLHLGNIFSFSITTAIAEKTNARILLRIDDLDRLRLHKEYVQDIFDTLNFLELAWDEGPRDYTQYEAEFSRIHRVAMYQDTLKQLREAGRIFACTCSRTQVQMSNADGGYPGTCLHKHIPLDTEGVSWRLDTTNAHAITVNTLNGIVTKNFPADMQYFMVRKKDLSASYHLASLLDDLFFGIDLIVRGDDLWHSTLAQLHLASVLGKEPFADVTFLHHPLFTDIDGEKLSKSGGATSVQYLRARRKTPADIFTMAAAMLGIKAEVKNWEELAALVIQ